MTRKITLLVLLVVFVLGIGFSLFLYGKDYTTPYNGTYWKDRYEASQWNVQSTCIHFGPHINPKTCLWDDAYHDQTGRFTETQVKPQPIGDDGLYAYAAWEYTKGRDPTLLNAEMPPFGKYVIGVLILVLKNQNIFALFTGILSLAALFLLARLILKDWLLAFIPVVLFSIEPLFYTQLRAPYLDLLYLSLLLFTFYFFLKNKLWVSAIFLGLMMGTKASLVTFGVVNAPMLFYMLLNRNKKMLKRWVLFLPVSLVVFTLTYSYYFFLGHNLIEFLKVQKWILQFYETGAKGVLGGVVPMFLTGTWYTWFGKPTHVAEWLISWPILFILLVAYTALHIKRRTFPPSFLLALFVIVYFIFLLEVPVFPRYFLVIIPLLYILAVEFVTQEVKVLKMAKKVKKR